MNKTFIKKLAFILGIITLIGNATPLFAQVVYLQILGGGYRLRGPSQINFVTLTASTFANTGNVNFRNIGDNTPSEADNNYLLIIDENGGNPFDVTVSATELKRNEFLETRTIAGSVNNTLKVVSSSGFLPGDTLILVGVEGGPYTISSIQDNQTIILQETIGVIASDITVQRIVDCDLSPRKCIPLSNFYIRNYDDNGDDIEAVFGNENDITLNPQTSSFFPFKGKSTTIIGSNGNTLLVNDTSTFLVNENIIFPVDSGVSPRSNTIVSIDDNNTITLQDAFVTPPSSDINVESANARTLTLVNGSGAAPGQYKIFPSLQDVVPAGQMQGLYESTLNFTIV